MKREPAHELGADPLVALLSHCPMGSGEDGPLIHIRRQAREAFLSTGLPTRRHENWRYTDLALIRRTAFRPVTAADISRPVDRLPKLLGAGRNAARLVFVNGGYRADLSSLSVLPDCISVASLAEEISGGGAEGLVEDFAPTDNSIIALNTAMLGDGVAVSVDNGKGQDVWLELVFIGGASPAVAYALRHVVRVGEAARLGIVEHHIAVPGEAAFANQVMQIELERGASLRHYRLIDGEPESAGVITSIVRAHDAAEYEAFALIVGGGLNRVETTVGLEGPRASCRIGGAYAAGGSEVCDNTTLVAHRAPKTTSRQVFRGVVDDHAHAVFQGRVIVDRAAQEADGHQLSKALLLSETAEIDQKPALEIFADNVKCSHGAAAGQLDPSAMFYLRSRGLSEAIARRMLLEGFLAEVLLEVSDEEVRRELTDRVALAIGEKGKEKG
jgi:Fe-S cluster assembly protein SufD